MEGKDLNYSERGTSQRILFSYWRKIQYGILNRKKISPVSQYRVKEKGGNNTSVGKLIKTCF